MLKVSLACRNVVKAAKAGPRVAWVPRALVDDGEEEWRGVRAALEEVAGGDVVQCDALVLTSGLIDALRLTIQLCAERDAPAAVYTAVAETLRTLASLYETQTWAPGSLVALADTVVALRHRHECEQAKGKKGGAAVHPVVATGVYDATVSLCLSAVRVHRAGNAKAVFEKVLAAPYYDAKRPGDSLLARLMRLKEPRLLAAFLFARPQEWSAFFPPAVTEEEVEKLSAAADEPPAAKAGASNKRDSLEQVFVCFAAIFAADDAAGVETVLDAFQATQAAQPVTVLRMMWKLLDLAPHPPAAVAGLLRVLRASGVYRSQQDILYQHSFGLALLKRASMVVTARNADGAATVACGEHLLHVYHKALEPDLGWYLAKAVRAGAEVGGRFVQACFDVYAAMQSLDVVLGAAMRQEAVLQASPAWLLHIYKTALPSILDAVPTAKMVLDTLEGTDECEVAACHSLAALAMGLKVTDTTAAPSSMWVDEVVDYAYKSVVKGANPASLARPALNALMNLYHCVQGVLDDASPSFLVSDIFRWSRRSVDAFNLGEGADPVVLAFPSATVTLAQLRACCEGEGDDAVLSQALCIQLLAQHALRAHRHRSVLAVSPDAEDEKKLLKRLRKELEACCGAIVEMWGSLLEASAGAAAVWRVSQLLCGHLHLLAEHAPAAALEAALRRLLCDAADVAAAAPLPPLGQASLWQLFPNGAPAPIPITAAPAVCSFSALALRLARAEDTWEAPALAGALRNIIASIFADANDALYTFACALLAAFPPAAFSEADDLMNAVCGADEKCTDVVVRSLLRCTLAHMAVMNPHWCDANVGTLRGWVKQAETDDSLAPATLAVGVVCLQLCDEARAVAFCGRMLKRLAAKGALGAEPHALGCMLAASVALRHGGAWQRLRLAPSDVAGLKKASKKRKHEGTSAPEPAVKKRKAEGGDAVDAGEAGVPGLQQLFEQLAAAPLPWNLVNGALLVMLARGCVPAGEDAASLRRKMARLSLKQFDAADPSSDWFLSVALECAAPALSKEDTEKFFLKIYKRLAGRPRAAPRGVGSGGVAALLRLRTHRVDTDGVEGVYLSKLPLLSKTGKEAVVSAVFSNAAAHLADDTSHVALAHMLLVTCPKEYTTAPAKINAFVMGAIATLHGMAASAPAAATPALLALARVVAAACLMEKLPLHGSAMPMLLTLPKLLLALPPSVELFYIVTNLLVNVGLHRLEEVDKHWGAYVHALGDVVEGLLQWVTAHEVREYAKDMVIETVRILALFTGAVRRPGVAPATKERIQNHAPVLLQRFLAVVVKHPSPANTHNRELSRGFSALMGACGKDVFAMTYAQMPQVCRTVAAAYHLQWQSSRFQGKT
eukprot:TRINITY_DN18255_c0_g1_i1.p1 TRINITY_DN18255_c0_g1~~TRINITY_DN18255_c0_g1_i1.p1  ORF type:complete len:1354 (+),score=500.09 TRINITY_DN18255_c0_g1_i1:79-4140(+)